MGFLAHCGKARRRIVFKFCVEGVSALVFYVYMLRCVDGSLYTGWTDDLERRTKAHNEGKGGRYTRSHRPVELVYSEELPSKSAAMRRECEIKSFKRDEKQKLLEGKNA